MQTAFGLILGFFPFGMFILCLIAIGIDHHRLLHSLLLPVFVFLMFNLIALYWTEPDFEYLRLHPQLWSTLRVVVFLACIILGFASLVKKRIFVAGYFFFLAVFVSDCLLCLLMGRYVGP
ncbi:MAG: hypothetical protein ACF8OB_10300 [Phycisphaeraceae bacterium JB051]